MSATVARPRPQAPPPAPPPAPRRPAAVRPQPAGDGVFAGRVAAFTLLALFATAHWVALLDPAPRSRALAITATALATGIGLAASARIAERPAARCARLAILVGGLALAMLAAGLPLRLLSSEHWGELGSGIADGLVAAGNVRPWPYAGDDAWLRQTVLLGAAPVTVLAAVAAFWPLRRGAMLVRTAGLALLVALFATATAAAEYDQAVLRGLALFALIAAWLWLPRLRGVEAAGAAVVLAAVGGLSGLTTAQVASSDPWVDYRNWSWSENARSVGFRWEHDYGPLDWPRRGTTLLAVKGPEAHYWKAQTLDFFDGTRWRRPPYAAGRPSGGVVAPERRGWTEQIRFTVRALRSDLVVGAGLTYDVDGDAEGALTLSDGTYLLNDTLESGETYTVSAYVPSPSAREMRAAELEGFEDWQRPYVRLGMATGDGAQLLTEFPLRGRSAEGLPDPADAVAGTPYERVYELALRLAAGRPTAYDVVKATERHLEREYEYAERVPVRRDPLPAFLFRDRRGYCQQFSGAMALLLRMNGIPARIASGFTPGAFDSNTREYRVRDYDAHSWVEVWFAGIGWVPFDPTPIAAPARAQGDSAAASAASGGAADRVIRRDVFAGSSAGGGAQEGGGPWAWIALAAAAGLLAAAVAFLLRARRPPGALGPDVDYLVGVFVRSGFTLPPGVTLLGLERRVDRLAGPGAARYVRQIRSRRFAPSSGRAPSPEDRRRYRLDLARAGGAGPVRRARVALAALTFRFDRS